MEYKSLVFLVRIIVVYHLVVYTLFCLILFVSFSVHVQACVSPSTPARLAV